MRVVTRIMYKWRGFSGDQVSESIFLKDQQIRVTIYGNPVAYSIRIDNHPYTVIHEGKAKSTRAAKNQVRKWLEKAGASLALEVKKKL